MPHADEALKALISRFEGAPESSAFVELAQALLARGHAAEALRIAEHGLQHLPDSADGRVERAAALLALSRPRVAYVELRRALAIDANHRRALRLLGRAYKDAGAPGRAAELLARRLGSTDAGASPMAFPPPDSTVPDAPIPGEPAKPISPNLFSNLTIDLGLGSAVPEVSQRRVEITQVIRRRATPRRPRSASELAAIDGPIVDSTQPGQIVEAEVDFDSQSLSPPDLTPLFEDSDQSLSLDATHFEVRPVATADLGHSVQGRDTDTIVEAFESSVTAPRPVDLIADLDDLGLPETSSGPNSGPAPLPPRRRYPSPAEPARDPAGERTPPLMPDPRRAPAEADASGPQPESPTEVFEPFGFRGPRPRVPMEERAGGATHGPRPSPRLNGPGETPPTPGAAVAPRELRRAPRETPTIPGPAVAEPALGRIVVVDPPARASRVALAVLAASAMLLYAAALVFLSADELRVWLEAPPRQAEWSAPER